MSHEISPLRPYEISINNYTTHKQLLLVKPPILLVKFNYSSSIFLVKQHVFLVKNTMFSGLNANLLFVVCLVFLVKSPLSLVEPHFLLVNQLINHHFHWLQLTPWPLPSRNVSLLSSPPKKRLPSTSSPWAFSSEQMPTWGWIVNGW